MKKVHGTSVKLYVLVLVGISRPRVLRISRWSAADVAGDGGVEGMETAEVNRGCGMEAEGIGRLEVDPVLKGE